MTNILNQALCIDIKKKNFLIKEMFMIWSLSKVDQNCTCSSGSRLLAEYGPTPVTLFVPIGLTVTFLSFSLNTIGDALRNGLEYETWSESLPSALYKKSAPYRGDTKSLISLPWRPCDDRV
jgi:hypothetical protein